MKKEDLAKHLLEHFNDEVESANKYYAMAENADKLGYDGLLPGLCDMVRDEYSHAQFIMNTMHEMNIEIPEAEMKKWDELEEKTRDLFW